MKLALLFVGGVVGLIAVVLIIGMLLPQKHVASREIVLRAAPSDVYAALRDFPSAPKSARPGPKIRRGGYAEIAASFIRWWWAEPRSNESRLQR
jgi:hypothetical protein